MKSFLVKWSEVSGNRWDPKFISYNQKINLFNYKVVKLKELLLNEPMYGANEPSCERKDENEPRYIRITDIDEFGNLKDEIGVTAKNIEKKYFLKENDLLIARSGATVGKTYLHTKKDYDCFFAGYLIKFVLDTKKVNPYYIFTYTQLDIYKEWIEAIQRPAAQPNINAQEYKNLPIPLPYKDTQDTIVKKIKQAYKKKQEAEQEAEKLLKSIDDYILKELNIKLPKIEEKNIKDRVFIRKWSEISGNRWDSEYYKKSYREFEKILNNCKYKVNKLKDIVLEIKTGTTPHNKLKPFTQDIENIPFLRNTNLQKNEINFKNIKYIKNDLKNELIYTDIGEVIICIAGTVGISAVNTYGKMAINQNVSSIKLKDDINPFYVSYFINTYLSQELIKRNCSVATIMYLNNINLKNILIPIPTKDIQDRIVDKINTIRDEAKKLKEKALQDFENTKKEIENMLLKDKK